MTRLPSCAVWILLLVPACREEGGGEPEREVPRAHPAPSAGGVLEGTVLAVSEGRLRVQPAAQAAAPVTLRFAPGIPITVDGRVAAWPLVPEGARVEASWMVEDGQPVAVRIEAFSPGGGFADPGPERPASR